MASKRAPQLTRHMSALVIEIKESVHKHFAKQMQSLFDSVDDALFDLAENAPNNQQQNAFFESMREIRFQRVDIEKRFLETIQQDFVDLFAEAAKSNEEGKPAAHSGEGSDFSLMDEDVVEEMVAIDSMVAKYEKLLRESIESFNARLSFLAKIDVDSLNTENLYNPIAPKRLCYNFAQSCKDISVDIKARIVLFKLFEKTALSGLDDLYSGFNDKCIEAGILPDLDKNRSRKSSKQPQSLNKPQQSLQEVSDELGSMSGMEEMTLGDVQRVNEIIQLMQYLPQNMLNLAGKSSQITNAIDSLPTSNMPAVGNEVLLQLLHSMQLKSAHQIMQSVQDEVPMQKPEDLLGSLGESLSSISENGDHSIGQRERDVIGLVSVLFEMVLEERVVAEPLKAVISSMQLPVIKVALQEPNFFCMPQHPARRLLNEMTLSSIGWVETENYHKDPLYKSIHSAVQKVVNEYDQEPDIFNDVLADLKSTLETENKRAELRKQRLVDAEAGRDLSATARAAMNKLISKRLQEDTPQFIRNMVSNEWNNVLFLNYIQYGKKSKEWQTVFLIMDRLLWSVAADRSRLDRSSMLSSLPKMLAGLRKGFELINMDKSKINEFFSQLEKIHMQIMQREPVDQEVEKEVQVNKEPVEKHDSSEKVVVANFGAEQRRPVEQESIEIQKEIPDIPEVLEEVEEEESKQEVLTEEAPFMAKAKAMVVGQWVELYEDDEKKRCRLVAILRNSGKRIFVNRTGAKAAEFTVDQIAELLEKETMVLLEDMQLFDKALTSIIDGLRQQKAAVNA